MRTYIALLQVGRLQSALSPDCARGDRDRTFHGHDKSREALLCSASMLRGGELEPEREVPQGQVGGSKASQGKDKLADGAALSTRRKVGRLLCELVDWSAED